MDGMEAWAPLPFLLTQVQVKFLDILFHQSVSPLHLNSKIDQRETVRAVPMEKNYCSFFSIGHTVLVN